MAELNRSGGEEILAEALRQEAAASRPEFSESRHARLCDAVRSAQSSRYTECVGSGTRSVPATFLGRRHWTLALSAAIALLAAVAVWQWNEQPGLPGAGAGSHVAATSRPSATQDDPVADLTHVTELTEQAAEGLDSLVDQAIISQQWAGLDQDARTALAAVIDHLPPELSSALAFSEPGGM
jgi:hypothetical protein